MTTNPVLDLQWKSKWYKKYKFSKNSIKKKFKTTILKFFIFVILYLKSFIYTTKITIKDDTNQNFKKKDLKKNIVLYWKIKYKKIFFLKLYIIKLKFFYKKF